MPLLLIRVGKVHEPVSFVVEHCRDIAHQESKALRLLLRAHGRYPRTRPANIFEGLPIGAPNCNDPSFSSLYQHRSRKEPACEACKMWRRHLEKHRDK